MSAVGEVVKGRSRVRCDGCGRISSDRDQGAFQREDGSRDNITGRGRECEHDFCSRCEDELNGADKGYRCCKCGRQPNAIECGADALASPEPSPAKALKNVARCVLRATEVKRYSNGRGRCATYTGSVDEIALAARQLAQMVLAVEEPAGEGGSGT